MRNDDASEHVPPPLAAAITRVREDREHGASWLSQQVAQALADAISSPHQPDAASLHQTARAFADARPSMAAVANTAARIWTAGTISADAAPLAPPNLDAMRAEALRILHLWDDAAAAIFRVAAPLLSGRLFTLSRSRTVEQTLVSLASRDTPSGEPRDITVCESRPGAEGIATARALAAAGWHVLLIPDMACAHFLPGAQAVITGADSVRADGSIVNKVGTHPVALAARAASIPFYAVCETLKIAGPDAPLMLEEMEPRELLATPVANITVRNLYFDHTPADLVTGIITERGLLTGDEIAWHAQQAGDALHRLRGI